jgi:hypothetical protein
MVSDDFGGAFHTSLIVFQQFSNFLVLLSQALILTEKLIPFRQQLVNRITP